MTRDIKQMITMKTSKFLTVAGACAGLALAGCARPPERAKSGKEPLPDELGGAAVTERETISKAGADQLIPKEKKRAITADQRADFEKAMKRYAGSPGRRHRLALRVLQRLRRVQARRRRQPGPARGALQPGRRALRVRARRRGGPDLGRRSSTARRSPTSATSPGRTTNTAAPSRSSTKAIDGRSAAQRRGAQQHGADPARQGAQGVEQRREEELRRPGGQQPAHGAGARQQQPAGVLHAGVHLLRHEHAGDGEAGR